MSKRRGGLRSGPAANPAFAAAIRLLQNETTVRQGIEAMHSELSNWLQTPEKLTRAARHYEAAAQIFTRRNVMRFCLKQLPVLHYRSGLKEGVRASCACRIDLAGGWTDTPPITMQIEHSAVVNIAVMIDGKKPIECEVRPLYDVSGIIMKELGICLATPEEIHDLSDKPSLPGSLICATILAAGLIQTEDVDLSCALHRHFSSDIVGLEFSTHSSLPHGSGLGTSSILAATLLAALWTLMGIPFDRNNIYHAVLLVEQYLTTGGGWQDQVGGTAAAIKISRFSNRLEQVVPEQLDCEESFIGELESKLLLIYTGRTRLAKNLLQEVVRSWFSRDEHITTTLNSLAKNAEAAAKFIRQGVFPVAEVEQYYEDKKKMAPGSEPNFIRKLIDDLKTNDLIEAAWLAGAGGGGFLYVWLKDGVSRTSLETYLTRNEVSC
ncbi:L-fucose kinase [Toxocara canis]|uniref:L-fucose kinase n=1 Tax=Toxocara canis TaxID=6265 RepID=A0A0B2VBV0_TOXCA|nr:L-fucose kinase [Toxocara canis]